MTQGRMHPEDARRETALEIYKLCDENNTRDEVVRFSVETADLLLAELARTAKPEAPKDIKDVLAPFGRQPWHCEYCGMVVDGGTYHDCKENTLKARAEQAEARVEELDNRLVIAESWRNDAALGLGEKRNKRIAELEQWQWDNMKKWLGLSGWGSMTPTQPECPTLIDAALQQGVEDAKRVDTLEARVKELEDAIIEHRNVHSKMPSRTRYEYELWAKVTA